MATKSVIKVQIEAILKGRENVPGLKKDLKALEETVLKVKKSMDFTSVIVGFSALKSSIQSVTNVVHDLCGAYAKQIEAETKLKTVMVNTMNATDAQIQSIKDLCAAQQKIGVIGDEVQLAGAQELATYLSEKQSLEQLIPVMNDMLAQQYGLNATQENAAQIATMLGKVMDGQVGALSRYGYSFDAAQEQILKYGTEAQRCAVLCDVVSASVGGMNVKVAQTDPGKQKQLANNLGDAEESLGKFLQKYQTYITAFSAILTGLASFGQIAASVKAIKGLTLGIYGFTKASSVAKAITAIWKSEQKALTAAMIIGAGSIKKGTAAATVYSNAAKGSAASTLAFGYALKGFLISSGVGIAIVALTTIIAKLCTTTDEATDSTKKFLSAEERAKREAEELEQLRQQEASTLNSSRAALEINISKLKDFNGTKEQEKKLVAEMNDTYGDTMGYFSSVADWYQALVANSEAYCRQMVIEARTRMLANRIAEKEQENYDTLYDETGQARKFSIAIKSIKKEKVGESIFGNPIYRILGAVTDKSEAIERVKANNQAIANLKQQMESSVKELASLNYAVKGSATRPDSGSGSGLQMAKTRLQELKDLISKSTEEFAAASESKREQIRRNIQEWKKEASQIELTMAAATRPDELTSMQDIDDEIAYQQNLRRNAAKENMAIYDAQIKLLNEEKEARELSAHTPIPIENITTYKQLNDEVSYYTSLLQSGSEEVRVFAQKNLNALSDIKEKWDETLEEIKPKKGVDEGATTLKEISKNISILSDQLQNASTTEEAARLNKEIALWQEKADAVQHAGEVVDRNAMSLKEITKNISILNGQLQSVTSSEEAAILNQEIALWKEKAEAISNAGKESANAFEKMREGWGIVKGFGSGIESITQSLQGNASAWQRVTGIVDGFLQIYDGISAIINIINTLCGVTFSHTAAKTSEAAAISVATGAQTAEAATAEVAAAALVPVIAANKAATASYMELASAAYFAAHAYIPFAGFGIASGFVASMATIVKSIGAVGVLPFANGGIVSGPTLGLIGEYAGASNNPEVVAPLDKLRSLLSPPEAMAGEVRFIIDGDKLVGVLDRRRRRLSRT